MDKCSLLRSLLPRVLRDAGPRQKDSQAGPAPCASQGIEFTKCSPSQGNRALENEKQLLSAKTLCQGTEAQQVPNFSSYCLAL